MESRHTLHAPALLKKFWQASLQDHSAEEKTTRGQNTKKKKW